MKWVSYFFFYTYIGLVIVAGFWGAFLNPYLDMKWLFQLDPNSLEPYTRVNWLSQYRFLRAIELGFGLFSIIFVKRIFSERTFNYLFLVIMSLGVLARLFSWFFDGAPSLIFIFFLIYELVGVVIIYWYTKSRVISYEK